MKLHVVLPSGSKLQGWAVALIFVAMFEDQTKPLVYLIRQAYLTSLKTEAPCLCYAKLAAPCFTALANCWLYVTIKIQMEIQNSHTKMRAC